MDDQAPPIGPDLEPTFSDPVQLEGRYEVDPIPGGKRLQGVWLVLDDGTRYAIAYRPIPEQFQFIDKRVRIYGHPYTPGRDTQHVMATHLQVDSIELAPGETPYPSPPAQVPPPPLVQTANQLAARAGRWATLIGTVESVQNDPDGYLGIALLRLQDGTEVLARNVSIDTWSSYQDKLINVTSRVEQVTTGNVTTFELCGWYTICTAEE